MRVSDWGNNATWARDIAVLHDSETGSRNCSDELNKQKANTRMIKRLEHLRAHNLLNVECECAVYYIFYILYGVGETSIYIYEVGEKYTNK